jgi:glycosyltransferase involved in cell wall biosynthesis
MDFLRATTHLAAMPQAAPNSRRVRHDVVFVHALDLPETISSYRYMSAIPAHEIGARFLRLAPDEAPDAFLGRTGAEVLVCGKAFENERLLQLCELARTQGRKVISWHCDLPATEAANDFSRRLIEQSDAVVVQTEAMAEFIASLSGRSADLIEECLEYPANTRTHFEPRRDPLQMLWYGHANNFDSIPSMLEALSTGVGANLSLLLLAGAPPPREIAAKLAHLKAPPLEAAWMQWSRAGQLQAMRGADIVLAPSIDGPAKQVKGHNRVSEALNQSCVVVAHPLPQYREFADFIVLERDMAAGIRRVLADPQLALERAAAGARVVRERFAPGVVARKWMALIDRVMAA